jgi:ABC-type thiamin/hydroxymethylpyrimidine transport system permease subunit
VGYGVGGKIIGVWFQAVAINFLLFKAPGTALGTILYAINCVPCGAHCKGNSSTIAPKHTQHFAGNKVLVIVNTTRVSRHQVNADREVGILFLCS